MSLCRPLLYWRSPLLALLVFSTLLLVLVPARAQALLLDGSPAQAVWPHVSLLRDSLGALGVADVMAQPARFAVPDGTPGNLGRTTDAVWLKLPLKVPPGPRSVRRVLEFNYPALNRIDVYWVQGGQVRQAWRLGNDLRMAERPLASRSHAVPLDLPPGDSELLMRVQSSSSMVLPITLRTDGDFTAHESGMQLLQGVFVGLALCMLFYSLSHWLSLRDPLFMSYMLLLAGNMVFMLTYFGIGAQYVWPDWPQLSQQMAPLSVLVAVAAGIAFIGTTLGVRELSPRLWLAMRGVSAFALAVVLAAILGLVDYRGAQTMATVLGISSVLGALPMAYARARRGDALARYMLVGWAFYAAGALTVALLLRGHLEPTFWALNLYALSNLVEMAAWMGVLGLRVQNIHRSADRARGESEALRALAHTDALTGLPNRRGLQDRLNVALRDAAPQQVLALYLLDLDGFKPVNDRHGHDVGDALLVAVGQRLRAQLRSADVVARLGGDEFVVLACGLADENAARGVGQKMLAAFNEPFIVAGQVCEVGLTIGCALAPHDAQQGEALLKLADAAMYAGKRAGRRQLQRTARHGAPAADTAKSVDLAEAPLARAGGPVAATPT